MTELRELIQWVKLLPCKCKDSSDLQDSCRCQVGVAALPEIPKLEGRDGDAWGKLASPNALIDKIQPWVPTCMCTHVHNTPRHMHVPTHM